MKPELTLLSALEFQIMLVENDHNRRVELVAVLFSLLFSSSCEEGKLDALQEMDGFERVQKKFAPGEMER